MKLKKLMAGMLAACTLASGSMAFAAEGDPVTPTADPKVELQMVAVPKSQTVEVGLNVEAGKFKSIGAVLTYDASQVELVDWKEGKAVSIEQGDAWSKYSTVPSKGSDAAMAKPALAYKSGNTGYLYLGADAFNPTALEGSTRLVTVRFKFVGETDEAAKAAFDALMTAIKNKDDTSSAFKVELASVDSASPMLANGNVECTVEESADTWITYVANAKGDITDDANLKVLEMNNKVADDIPSEEGGSGSGASGDVYGVTFLDWDGTIIGTATVPKDPTQSKSAIETLEKANSSLKNALTAKTGYEFDCWLNANAAAVKDGTTFTSNNKALAADAAGVADLAKLSDYATTIGDAAGVTLQAAYKAKLAAGVDPANADYTNVNTFDPSFAPTNSARNSDYALDTAKLYFTRYGGATQGDNGIGKYGIRVAYNRINGDVGAQRAVDPVVVVKMKPRGTSADNARASLYEAINGDTITAEIAPTRDIETLTIMLGERSGAPSWIDSPTRSGSAKTYNMLNVIRRGTANYILEQAVKELNKDPSSEWNLNVTVETLNDLTLTDLTAAGGDVTDANLSSYKEKIIAKDGTANTELFEQTGGKYSVKSSVSYEALCKALELEALPDEQ